MIPPRILTPRQSPRRTPPKTYAPTTEVTYIQDEDVLNMPTYQERNIEHKKEYCQ